MKPVRPTRPQLISGRARFAFAALALSLLAACTDSPVEPTVETTPAFGPDLTLIDGSTGGNPDFWWLPPTIPLWDHPYANPDFERDRFDRDLRPFVDICEDLDRNHICDGAATSVEADLQPWLAAYSASYRTSRRDRNKIFLATARVDDIVLGQVHVVVKLSNYQDGDAFVIPGLWAIFRFSIEEDALCIANDPDFQQGTQTCTSETVGPEGGEVVLEVEGTPTLSVQIPATGTPTTITISNECVEEWPLALPQLSDCFHVDESAGLEFDPGDPAVVCLLVGTGGSPNFHDEITLYQFGVEDETPFAQALPRVNCTEEVAALGTGGPLGSLARLARAVGSFIGPEPLHAAARRRLHFGGGGSVTTFKSDFVFSVPLAIERFGFEQGQDAPTGATLEASVLVYFDAVEGGQVPYDGTEFPIDIAFTVLQGGGTAVPTVFTIDDPSGIATTSWTVGSSPGVNRLEADAGDGFGNDDSEIPGPFYSDDAPTDVIFGEGSVVFEVNGVEEEPLTILPAESERLPGGTQQFTLEGGTGPFTWSVNGVVGGNATFGTITDAGFYQAPDAVPDPDTFQVCALDTGTGASACAQVTIQPIPSAGEDVVVFNDINIFDNQGMDQGVGDPNNHVLVENLVGFTSSGPRSVGTKVWWDIGRVSSCAGLCTPTEFSSMASVITEAGYTIESIASMSGTLVDIPNDVKVILLWNPTVAYTAAEINALKAFAAEGGRTVFIGEHEGFYGAGGIAIENEFLDDMGAEMVNLGASVDCGYVDLPGASLRFHQVTEGMTAIRIACASVIEPGPNDFAFLYDSTNTLVLGGVAKIDVTPLPLPAGPLLAETLQGAGASLTEGGETAEQLRYLSAGIGLVE